MNTVAIQTAVNRQIDRLKAYCQSQPDITNTKTVYQSQRDNRIQPHRTCNTTSNCIYLNWLFAVTGKNRSIKDDQYFQQVQKFGDTIYHGVQTSAIKQYGFSTKWMTDRDLPFVIALLKKGFPVPVNILHRGSVNAPRGGHIICLIAYQNNTFTAHDPYGTLESNYTNPNGAYSKISLSEFKKRWQGGYRILA